MERLIIISPRQYGYQTDYLKYVEYLPEWYDVVFICLDQGERKFLTDKADIRYVRCCSRRLSYLFFFVYSYFYILFHSGKVMSTNFNGCRHLKRLMPWRKMVVNIRTVSLDSNPIIARSANMRILEDASPFDRIIMISEGGARQLCLPMDKVDIVGLGADEISSVKKSYYDLKLLYVGTLSNRHILETVIGFHKYLQESGDGAASYDIVGDGEELESIRCYVRKNVLSDRVLIHGRKPYDELKPYFDRCNVGVSYVPVTEGYAFQPPTKTYEYMLSGLYTIATETRVHRDTVMTGSGCLIKDTPEAFSSALHHITDIKENISDSYVRRGAHKFLWRNVIAGELVESLKRLQ